MLLARKQVQDKQGRTVDMVTLKVVGNDGYQNVTLPEKRYLEIQDALKAFGYWLPKPTIGDATDPLSFFVSQLAYTEAQMFAKQRIPPLYRQLVPISNEAPPWAESVEYQTFDKVGKGKRIAANATDIPLVDVSFGRKIIEVAMGGLGYHYNQQELRASVELKKPLSDLRMAVALEAYERHMNEVALNGEGTFSGLWNNANVTPVQATTGGWDDAATSPMTILSDINTAMLAVYENTGTNDVVTHVAMPLKALNALATRIVTGVGGTTTYVTGTTILKFLKENCLSKVLRNVDVEFVGVPGLETAGTKTHGGGDSTSLSRVVYFCKNPERMVMHIPMTLQFLAPQLERLNIVVPGCYRYAGLELRYPKSVYYQDSVLATED